MVRGSAVGHGEHLQDLRGKLQERGAPGPAPGLGPTGYGDSPYQSLSSFAGNPLLISPDWLIEDGLLRASDGAGASFPPTTVDFEAVKRFKYALLETAWKSFSAGAHSGLRPDFER